VPVLGHAVAGWALAVGFEPRPGSPAGSGRAFWIPALIGLSFLPDVASQAAIAAGARDPTSVTHSLLLTGGAALVLAAVIRRWTGLGRARAVLLGLLLVPGHVLLDLLQSPWRSPFWPFSAAPAGPPWPLLPRAAGWEALLSGLVFLLVLGARRFRKGEPVLAAATPPRRLAAGLTAAIVVLAGITHHVRGIRERRYEGALERLAAGDAAAALRLIDEADRWPWPSRPGRIDYLRAEAHQGLHDRETAERHLLLSLRADPGYFWAWADLCVLYAASDRPLAERRQRSLPCLQELETRFADHPDRARMAGKVHRALERE
jgi:membrane-bound metal-dependent hydrolase YbcI (DUF457 family)